MAAGGDNGEGPATEIAGEERRREPDSVHQCASASISEHQCPPVSASVHPCPPVCISAQLRSSVSIRVL